MEKDVFENGMKMEKKGLTKFSMIAYGLGDLASQFVWTFVGTYLTVFYTDIVGLAPVAVSMIMLIARLWDGINDPMMGMIAERTRSKLGRFRPYIAFGSPFLALFSVLTFTGPFGNGTAGIIWAAVIYIIAGMIYTLVNIPYGALAAVMSEDANERNQLNAWRSVGMNVGMIIVNSLSSFIMLAFSDGSQVATGRGYFMTALIYAVISIPLFFAVFATSREVVQPMRNENKVPFRTTIKNVIGNKYLMIVFLIMILQMTAFMGRIAVTTFYVIYCLGAFTLIALLMTIPSIGGALCSLAIVPLVKRFGKRNVLMVSLILQGIGLLVVCFADFDNLPMIIAGHVIFGLFNMGFPISLSLVADSVDYQELKSGVRTDGTAYATYGLATKIGNAIGASVGIMLLHSFGYRANMEQSMATKNGINLVVNLIPAILFFAAALACLLWNLSDKDTDDIRAQLDKKRENIND
ncbi:MFS transporter [Enterococcus avium]|uniref:MFS transporter n=1 Tax=Enterococcus avium TaxID=33945 RepID=UPI002891E986|nr:MFS transporter [Enterococcus avium]MDT2410178.1 MFS transporter [Enterococcus avium]MDT2414542.1 MFS transporter [Enterococcus avium]MDT2445067.1 MFS transporter [Enterococcus avium]MDT2475208.1 MFS transporter [Enterococcus avium]